MRILARAILAGSISVVVWGTAHGEDAATEAEAAFLSAWEGLPERGGWRLQMTPAFPRAWPPVAGEGAGIVRYAFAMRLRLGLADGVEIAAPWATGTQTARGHVTVEVTRGRLDPIGIQGVRPMGAQEGRLAAREEEVANRLLAGGEQAESGLVREFTCGWIRRNGAVANVIAPSHTTFIRWLACGSAGSAGG